MAKSQNTLVFTFSWRSSILSVWGATSGQYLVAPITPAILNVYYRSILVDVAASTARIVHLKLLNTVMRLVKILHGGAIDTWYLTFTI